VRRALDCGMARAIPPYVAELPYEILAMDAPLTATETKAVDFLTAFATRRGYTVERTGQGSRIRLTIAPKHDLFSAPAAVQAPAPDTNWLAIAHDVTAPGVTR
jgi:hypothetical protein